MKKIYHATMYLMSRILMSDLYSIKYYYKNISEDKGNYNEEMLMNLIKSCGLNGYFGIKTKSNGTPNN